MSKFQLDNGCSCLLELSINRRLLLYNLVDMILKLVCLHWQFWDLLAKNKLQIYNPMCFYAVCYSLARNISGICWVHVQHINYVNCFINSADCAVTQICKQLLYKLTKCKKCLYSIIINQTKLYNLYCCCIMLDVMLKIILLHYCMVLTSLPSSWLKF
jgi:hypothetical protein